MFFRQVLHEDLGCASYFVADAGEAAVIDPKWEIEDYLALADEHGLRIAHVLETHNHADHVSGHGRLQAATGATIHVPRGADVEYEHAPLSKGDSVELGSVRLVALPTPGHRPEHTAYAVVDGSRSDQPWLVLTGDSLFVGDVARPDLAVDEAEGARDLFHSLRSLLDLGDFAEVWPGHIGGSLCGGAGMSEKPGTTVGFERRFNPRLDAADEEAFVAASAAVHMPQPPNFERIVELNRGPLLIQAADLEPLAPNRVDELLRGGAVLLDGRDVLDFDAAHVPGSLSLTMAKGGVGTRAAWVADPEGDTIVTAPSEAAARHMGLLLEAVGFRSLVGFLAGGLPTWRQARLPVESMKAIDIPRLAELLSGDEVVLVDVREDDEWNEGHVGGALHAPYHELREQAPTELREAGRPLAVACSAGTRSSLAASLLRRQGIEDVVHVVGDLADLPEEGVQLV
jgi:hydroxyacylglutathione hydrolase